MNETIKKYDVVIVGGGTAGCASAYMCAKLKLKTLLVEKNNFLGGLMTGGLVVPVMKSSVGDLNNEYYKKLVKVAKKYNSQIKYKNDNDGWFNPEMMKIVLEDILTSKTIKQYLDILLETEVDSVSKKSNNIESIVLKCNLLSIPIVSTYFIDTTGSASFSKLAGCEMLPQPKEKQQNTLRFILGNVDIEKFAKFIKEVDDNEDITNTYRNDIDTNNELHLTTASTWDTNRIWALDKYLKKGVSDKILKSFDRAYFQVFSIAGSCSQIAFNCPRIKNYIDDPYKYSSELIGAKQAIYRLYTFVKTYFKGFENSILTNIATQTGIREQNRVKTKYIYTYDDLMNCKTFKNPVLRANYGIDIHGAKKNKSVLKSTPSYELPLESLISADVGNLFVAGKIIGADFKTHSALRVQKSAMSTGEAIARHIRTLI